MLVVQRLLAPKRTKLHEKNDYPDTHDRVPWRHAWQLRIATDASGPVRRDRLHQFGPWHARSICVRNSRLRF